MHISYSQVINEREIETLFENISKETTNSEDIDKIDFYSNNPIYIRYSSISDLEDIPGINQITARKIHDFIQKHKSNQNLNHKMLNDSLNLSVNEFLLLLHCTKTEINKSLENYHKISIRARNQHQFQTTKGYSDSAFLGDKFDFYQRIRYQSKNISASFLTDKSSGERFINDFMSGGISYQNDNLKLIVGDFTSSIGMGTLLWRQFGASKSSEVFYPVTQTGRGANLYTSALEFNYFRGIAANYKINSQFEISSGLSNINRASTIDNSNNYISSIYNAGYFRTETEISKRNNLNESMGYFNFNLNDSNYSIGALIQYLNYDKEINGESSALIKGNGGLFSSLFYKYFSDRISTMAEFTMDNKQNIALKSFIAYEFEKFKIVMHPRYFSKDFRSMFGFNFGEFSYPSNEFGIYTGIQYKLTTQSQFSFYFDKFSSIGRTYTVPFIVSGSDLFAEYKLRNSSNDIYLFRLKYESKTQAISDQYKNRISYPETKFSIRLDLQNNISENLTIRQRVDAIYTDFDNLKSSETGISCFFEFNYQLNKYLFFGARIGYYSTDSFDSALWQYEYSIPGMMTSNANYGDGTRTYFHISIMPIDEITIRAKYTKTQKQNTATLSSGLNQINGNIDDRLYLQIDCIF